MEVFGLSWGGGNRDLFGADERVDGGGFADVGIANQADLEFALGPYERLDARQKSNHA